MVRKITSPVSEGDMLAISAKDVGVLEPVPKFLAVGIIQDLNIRKNWGWAHQLAYISTTVFSGGRTKAIDHF